MDNIFYFLKKANKKFSLWYIPHPQNLKTGKFNYDLWF